MHKTSCMQCIKENHHGKYFVAYVLKHSGDRSIDLRFVQLSIVEWD